MFKCHHGKPIGIFGLFRGAHIGNWLIEHLDITDLPAKHAANIFHQWFNDLNWDTYIKEKEGTSTQMMLREPGSDESKRVSLYHYDGEDTSYSYISPAELFCIHDPNTDGNDNVGFFSPRTNRIVVPTMFPGCFIPQR